MYKLPCGVRARLDNMCPGKIMIAKGSRVPPDYGGIVVIKPNESTHPIWMERIGWGTAYLQGPGWRALVHAFCITLRDMVIFNFDQEHRVFNVEVLSGDGDIKPWSRCPGMLVLYFFVLSCISSLTMRILYYFNNFPLCFFY